MKNCSAITTKGIRCKSKCEENSPFCKLHEDMMIYHNNKNDPIFKEWCERGVNLWPGTEEENEMFDRMNEQRELIRKISTN